MSSFRRGPNVLLSGALGALAGVAIVGGAIALLSFPAFAQNAASNPASSYGGDFERPFGFSYGQETQAFDANTRDANGNRLIVDGRIMTGMDQSTLSMSTASASAWAQASAGAGFGGSVQNNAIGNQLNVITQGNYNTVIVNSTQTNTGNQSASSSSVLNGKINLQ
ncbi:MAG TPA: holdfast anchoring protein HfaA [Hyphomonadaceae bacterium]|nr:holdfast anchoring protein HfaA [Hyphomonadaceae bacterium]